MQYIVFIGVVVQLYGVFVYGRETLKGNTKPNRVSWFLWSVAPLIATAAALADGVRLAVLPVFMSGFAPFLIFILSFFNKQSYWKLNIFDYLCGLCSVLALVLWAITNQPLVAIVFAVLADGFAAIPTLYKAWKFPETESVEAYSTGVINAGTSFFAISTWTLSSLAFPIYLLFINTLLTIIVSRKYFKKQEK